MYQNEHKRKSTQIRKEFIFIKLRPHANPSKFHFPHYRLWLVNSYTHVHRRVEASKSVKLLNFYLQALRSKDAVQPASERNNYYY